MQPSELYGRPWSEREYLLVLDAYFATTQQRRHVNTPIVLELAQLLGRTPASIHMRMENYASIDPDEFRHRKGLSKIGPLGAKIFGEWQSKRDHLASCAAAFRRDIGEQRSMQMRLFEPPSVVIPKAFDKYELLDSIGHGGFGHVYSCIHVDTGHVGAIKIIHAEKVYDAESLHRFTREIRTLKAIDHPNVIRLREDNLDSEKKFPAFVMELAECNLTDHIEKTAASARTPPFLPLAEAVGLLRSMVAALGALHGHSPRIIHRDLNPNNILRMPDGRWVLADFGLAKFLDTASGSTSFNTRTQHGGWGAGYYAAPEQYRDFKRTNERTDIYALGILLWELFSNGGPPPDRQNTGLPSILEVVYLKATDRMPESRYSSINEFSDAFECFATSELLESN
jgi:serine/threonine protein kinase